MAHPRQCFNGVVGAVHADRFLLIVATLPPDQVGPDERVQFAKSFTIRDHRPDRPFHPLAVFVEAHALERCFVLRQRTLERAVALDLGQVMPNRLLERPTCCRPGRARGRINALLDQRDEFCGL